MINITVSDELVAVGALQHFSSISISEEKKKSNSFERGTHQNTSIAHWRIQSSPTGSDPRNSVNKSI